MYTRTVCVALLVGLSGCYNYLPLTTPDPQPGTRVTAQLTDSASVALAGYLGPDVEGVDGRLLTITDQQVGISVVAVKNRNGVEHYWKGETVTLPRGEIAVLRERKLAPGRSALLVLAGVGGSVALMQAFGVFNLGSSGVNLPPPPK